MNCRAGNTGGGIRFEVDYIYISDSEFLNNYADYGGALAFFPGLKYNEVDSTFTNNFAFQSGGMIFTNSFENHFTINDSINSFNGDKDGRAINIHYPYDYNVKIYNITLEYVLTNIYFRSDEDLINSNYTDLIHDINFSSAHTLNNTIEIVPGHDFPVIIQINVLDLN